jgi:hypothetical protein
MNRSRLVALLCLLMALALAFAACGGDDDDDTADNAGGTTATADAGDGDDDAGDETAEPTKDTGDDDDGSSAGAVDACSLVARDEAEAALGAQVGEGEPEDFPPVFSCRYETDGFDFMSVSVLVYPDSETARGGYQLAIDINDYPEIEGLGDGAYFALGFGVTALQDKYEVTIDVLGPDDDQPLEEDLVRKALERLPR